MANKKGFSTAKGYHGNLPIVAEYAEKLKLTKTESNSEYNMLFYAAANADHSEGYPCADGGNGPTYNPSTNTLTADNFNGAAASLKYTDYFDTSAKSKAFDGEGFFFIALFDTTQRRYVSEVLYVNGTYPSFGHYCEYSKDTKLITPVSPYQFSSVRLITMTKEA